MKTPSACCHAAESAPPPGTHSSPAPSSPAGPWFRFGLLTLAAGLLMTGSLAVNLDSPPEPARTVIHTAFALVTLGFLIPFGWPIARRALTGRITLESLFLIGITGTYAASLVSTWTGTGHIYYEVVLVLLAIYQFGQLISARQRSRALDVSNHVPGLRVTAAVQRGSAWHTIPAREVNAGDRVRVSPGEAIPVDGRILHGTAFLEELAHTGEPFPVVRGPGHPVLAGTRVLDGELVVEATVPGTKRVVDRIFAAIEHGTPARVESLAQRILNLFVPAVVSIAILTFLGWWIASGNLQQALFNALAVTIVACPCGLGLAIPLAVRSGSLNLQLLGIRPEAGDLLDRLAAVDTVAFDKTGTLSHPRLELAGLETTGPAPQHLAPWLARIQRQSTHPVARPFWRLAQPAELKNLSIDPIPGRGISATFTLDGAIQNLTIGNETLLRERESAPHPFPLPENGERLLFVFWNGLRVATARLREQPRDSALEATGQLRRRGLRVELLTGDASAPPSYHQSCDRVGLSLTSSDKAARIRDAQRAGHRILYVGDGLNDIEAFRAADAALALESGGAAAAAAAHGVLTHDDLTALPQAIDLARAVRRRLHHLLACVLGYNGIGIALAAAGLLHPVVAALLMLASSATVLGTASRPTRPARSANLGEPEPWSIADSNR